MNLSINYVITLLITFLSSDHNKSQSNLPGQMDPLLDTDHLEISQHRIILLEEKIQ